MKNTTILAALVSALIMMPAAADDLRSEGLLTSDDTYRLNRYLAYGDGWPFHHHHLHFSWDWESGHEQRSAPPEGCQLHPLPPPTKKRLGPGR